jgi:hypothetical protein
MDADFTAIAGMILSLLMVLAIGGMILLYPLTRRLGALMEQRLAEKSGTLSDAQEVRELRRAVEYLQGEVARLSEEQEFMDSLMKGRGLQERVPQESLPRERAEG